MGTETKQPFVQPLTQIEIEEEIRMAEMENRKADFKGKTLTSFSILEEEIKIGLILEDATILGPVSLGGISINNDLNLKNTTIKGPLYLAKASVRDNIILENADVKGAINLVGAKIGQSVMAKNLKTKGFVSLSKANIGGDVCFHSAMIENEDYEGLIVKGDLFFDFSIVKGNIDLSNAKISGILNFQNVIIEKNLNLEKLQIEEGSMIIKTARIKGVIKSNKDKMINGCQ